MQKVKIEVILILVLIPVIGYVGTQAYNTYIKKPNIDITQLDEQPATSKDNNTNKSSFNEKISSVTTAVIENIKNAERNPFKHSLPVTVKKDTPKEKTPEKTLKQSPKPYIKKDVKKDIGKDIEKTKQIVLPTFSVSGIVWGTTPRAIIDSKVYKVTDVIKGAKILNITKEGILMLYEGKEFWVKS